MATCEIQNIGPVSHASIPIPEEGGVVVLKGRNGAGKTRTLEAVEAAVSGRGKPEVRDGALTGEVKAFGVTIKVGRSTRRSGELEVSSLDGRLSVAELVDPGLKSPDAADARRIKALIQVANVAPSVELFHELLGGREQFEAVVSAVAVETADLVAMSDRIKRDCEAAARKEEDKAAHAEGRARGAHEAAAGVDTEVEANPEVLQKQLEVAIRAESELKANCEAAQKASDQAALARTKLVKAESEFDGPSLDDALEAEKKCETETQAIKEAVAAVEQQLAKLRNEYHEACHRQSQAIALRKSVEQHEKTIDHWREQIAATVQKVPSVEERQAAAEAVVKAREAVEAGAIARAARATIEDALKFASSAIEHRKRAAELRSAAKGTDEVLSSVIARAGTPLRVEAGRLVLDTKRGATYYGELSHGERWRIALDIAIKAVGQHGVIVVEQEAWEGLDPYAREAIADQVRGSGVVILTAECSADQEVTAEVFA